MRTLHSCAASLSLVLFVTGIPSEAHAQEAPRMSPYAAGTVPLPPLPRYPLGWSYRDDHLDVIGGPGGSGLERVVTVDGQRLPVEPPSDGQPRRVYVGHLERGPHLVRVEVRRGEEIVEFAEGTFRARVRYSIEARAGMGWSCATLDGEAAAPRSELRALARAGSLRLRMDVRDGQSDGDALGVGTAICVSAPFFAGTTRYRHPMPAVPGREPIEVTLRGVARPGLRVVPACAFTLFLGLLLFGHWPPRRRTATHLAWSLPPAEGYRDRLPHTWSIAPLPKEPCALQELSPELEGVAHTVASNGQRARFFFESAVAVGTPKEPHLAFGDTDLAAGGHAVDGGLHLAVFGERETARFGDGDVPEPWSPEALERAHGTGILEVPIPTASRPRVVVFSVVGALLAIGVAYVPAYGSPLFWGFRPPIWTGLYWVHLAGFVVGFAAVVTSIAFARRRRRQVS
ncbi:MAG: hypothetical protein AB8I08_28320 [Sandaracinaceae bacterium]